ncbi:LOW QUALITY PROTEIN: hypothetical protein Cgig2_021665 [Carnegiea gigantea]|uniref:Uncharacterized protein n=1 Tax=Carnegiea gigantea TaxID=171969 RepID=A0A9Q1KB51_9CARY|nr:LOW QUALITY PROTEIN: hypothetical protein Cgig2_021665 [Carnegiea gigantea]
MPEFILAKKFCDESFKRKFIIYLVNYFFSGLKNRYCSKSILKFIKDVTQITSLNWCQFVLDKLITSVMHYKRSTDAKGFQNLQSKDKANENSGAPSFNPTLSLHKPDSEDQISRIALVTDASVNVEKEDHREDMVLNQPNNVIKKDNSILSYSLWLAPDSQNSVPLTTSVPDPSTARVNEDNGSEEDDDSTLLKFPLRNTSWVNHELSIKKPVENKSKEGDKPSSKKGEVRKHTIKIKKSTLHRAEERSPRAYSEQQAPDSSKPKLTKEVLSEKDHKKPVVAVRTPEKSKELTKLDSELSQDEVLISQYVSGKVEDVDDSECLFDGCGNKKATGVFMATLKP